MTERQDDEAAIMERWHRTNTSVSITPMVTEILDLPPSCVEFVPWNRSEDGPVDDHFFVVGTYNLQKEESQDELPPEDMVTEADNEENKQSNMTPKKPQSRNGSLNLFNIRANKLALVQKLLYPSAILDVHFLYNLPIFALVSSTGTISVYKVSKDHRMEHVATHQIFSSDILILSFGWYPYRTPKEKSGPLLLAITLSTGSVHLVRFSDSDFAEFEILNDSQPLIVHTLEAWCCAFSVPQEDEEVRLYSGGDDAKIRMVSFEPFSVIKSESHVHFSQDVELSAKAYSGHDSGVTAILPLRPGILLTGSYDDHVRVYPTSKGLKSKSLAELYIGGGVWRLKLMQNYTPRPDQSDYSDAVFKYRVLASCMHAGARILEVEGKAREWSIKVLGEVKIHESMCYGSDVQPVDAEDEEGKHESRICVSTSFYDKLLCVWRFDPKKAA